MDNLLVSRATGRIEYDGHPHLGLLSLQQTCHQHQRQAEVFDAKLELARGTLAHDPSLYIQSAELILRRSPDVVGFTTLGCSFLFAVRVAEVIKRRRPELPIILGGPHATILHREILEEFSFFDAVLRHEAESTIVPALEALETHTGQEAVPGLSWRAGSAISTNSETPAVKELDQLPDVTGLYPPESSEFDWVRLEAGRGCPFSCTFCSTATFFGRAYRLKSPERLRRDMDELNRRFGVTRFLLNHDLFTVDRRKVLDCCQALEGRGYTWSCSARIDCVDEPLLEAMWRAGCRRIFFGIETGSQRMQKVSRKNLDLRLLPGILAKTQALGIFAMLSFIAGYPEETQEDFDETLNCLGGFFHDPEHFGVQLHLLTPEPGTQLYQAHARDWEFDGTLTDFNAVCLDAADRRLIEEHPAIFPTYYYYRTTLPRKRFVRAVELVRLLGAGGFETAEYLLRFFGGNLSRLAEEFGIWQELEEVETANGIDLVQFFSERFGVEHHVTSLVRISQACAAGGTAGGTSQDPLVLDAIHDGVRLLALVRETRHSRRLITEKEAGGRASFAVVYAGTGPEIHRVEPD